MFLNSLKKGHYLRSTVVLAIDVVASVMASLCVLLFFHVLDPTKVLSTPFLTVWFLSSFGASLISFYALRTYRLIIRYATLHDLGKLCAAVFNKELLMGLTIIIAHPKSYDFTAELALLVIDYAATISLLLLIRVMMVALWQLIERHTRQGNSQQRLLVYGTDSKSASLVTRLQHSPHYKIVGFITSGESNVASNVLQGKRIYTFHDENDIRQLARKLHLDGILFSESGATSEQMNALVDYGTHAGLKLLISPSIGVMGDENNFQNGIRKINIEDLLGRSEIKISMGEICDNMKGKTVLITGAAGSIGSELCRQLAKMGVKELVLFDNAETPLHNVRLEFEDNYPDLKFTPVIGDVRSLERLDYVFRKFKPQIVFHASAYKHVPLMEENPCEAVYVNVIGSRNVADKCIEYDVEKMVMISTDKAVNPSNIMGCSKRLAEIYVQSLGLAIEKGEVKGKTKFVTTRFGNVLGSNGSVIPRFTEQIEKGGPLTVTHPEIRRFFMTIPEACRLVMEAATIATGTQIFVFDMGTPIKISDLAKRMIHLAGYEVDRDIKIEYTGLRPGEKLYEEVLANKENTLPTSHNRIFVAKVRDYDYLDACKVSKELEKYCRVVDIPDMVRLMKKTVPEFKSKHSVYEQYDAEENAAGTNTAE